MSAESSTETVFQSLDIQTRGGEQADLIPFEDLLELKYGHFSPQEITLSALTCQFKARIAQRQMSAISMGYGTHEESLAWLGVYQKAIGDCDPI